MANGYLVLENGTVFEGELFGSQSEAVGEVVFETGMDGYQESLTDPTGRGQILVMTYPLVGNYGMHEDFYQSADVHVRGLVVLEYCKEPSPMYGGRTIDEFMKKHGTPGIAGIDTRELTIMLRTMGSVKGAIVKADANIDKVIADLKKMPVPSESNLVAEVSGKQIVKYDNGKELTVGMIDCGAKKAILDQLCERFNVVTFPYDTPADVIVESGVKGVLISNGPGNPMQADIRATTVKCVSELTSQMPLFGICYGSQIIALALGASTYKMKFGHHGCNQPVKFENRVYITSQNHDFAVDEHSLDGTGAVANMFNVNDGSVEGFVHRDLPIFATQFRPEASPGPLETMFVFDRFGKMVKEGKL